jgi:SPX domain protein involved in polyphosphate accumulation
MCLDHLGKQLHNLELASWPPSRTRGRIPNSRLAKYSKIEDQAIQVGEEIKLLSRFVSAQRTAFAKLLKKYTKWTKRDILTTRFNAEIVDNLQSFVHSDLTWHLDIWTSLLNGIRLAMGQGDNSVTGSPSILPVAPKQTSSDVARRINDAMESNSDLEFDTVFTYSPLGNDGSRAVYWVHSEQLVEVQVLLLQHTRSAFSRPSTSNGTQTTPSVTRRSSITRRDSSFDKQPDHGVIVLDDGDRFAQKQNSIPLVDVEEAYSRPQTQPAATVMWTANNEAIMCIGENFTKSTKTGFEMTTRIKKKHIGAFLDWKKPFSNQSSGSSTPVSGQPLSSSSNIEASRTWLRKHQQVSPLVAFVTKRSRFATLPVTKDHGQWCTLDTDVILKKITVDDLEGKEWPQRLLNDPVKFPYAILQVRQEGKNDIDFINLLDESHLVSNYFRTRRIT